MELFFTLSVRWFWTLSQMLLQSMLLLYCPRVTLHKIDWHQPVKQILKTCLPPQREKCFCMWAYISKIKQFKKLLPLPYFHFKLSLLLHTCNAYAGSIYVHEILAQSESTNRFPKCPFIFIWLGSPSHSVTGTYSPLKHLDEVEIQSLNLPCFKWFCANYCTFCHLSYFLASLGRNPE